MSDPGAICESDAASVDPVATEGEPVPALTGAELARLGRALPSTFDIALASPIGSIRLRAQALLRVLPGRRIVVKAVWDGARPPANLDVAAPGVATPDGATPEVGRTVVAKMFVGPRAAVEREWEERGHAAFARAGVATPAIITAATFAEGGEALLFEYLEDATPATEADLPQAMSILARLHAHGVVQSDLHLGNLLRTARGLFLIDGGGVSGMGEDAPLSVRASVRNLALFLAQFDIHAQDRFVAAWRAYCDARAFKPDVADNGALLSAVRRARRARIRVYLRKVLRDCSEFHAERGLDYFLVCERAAFSPRMEALIDDIEVQFEHGAVVKAGNTASVVRLYIDGEALVIKRYKIKSWRHGLARMWRPTRAQRAWQNAHRLRMLGIATFHPIALIEQRFGPLRRGAYLVMRDVGGIDLRERFESGHVRLLAALFRDLSSAGLVHGDMKATNFIAASGRIHLIDLDSMRAPRTQRAARRGLTRDIERFIANWADSATIRAALSRAFSSIESLPTTAADRLRR